VLRHSNPGFDSGRLTISCTHTHTAPALRRGIYPEPAPDPEFMDPDQYRAWLVERLAKIVLQAWNRRRPGAISRGFAYAVVGRCRRAVYADGTAQMYGSPDREDFVGFESCDDHAVNLLFTRDDSGKLTGMLVNLACPAQCHEKLSSVSSDFWHPVREKIAARYGGSVHLLPQCAPAGDLSPHLLADQKEEKDLRERLGVDDCGIIARRIMAAVDEGLETASEPETNVGFAHVVETFFLPRLLVNREQYERERQIPALSEEKRRDQPFGFGQLWPFGEICDLVARYENQGTNPEHDVECHVIRIGDVVFATNPFELFVDFGIPLPSRRRALQTFLLPPADG